LGLLHRTAADAEAKNQQALAMTHQLSAQLRAAEDRMRELETHVRYQERADRAEKWLHRISLEIEQQFFGRDAGFSLAATFSSGAFAQPAAIDPRASRRHAADVLNSMGSTIDGSSFSGLFTLVEIGHMRIGSVARPAPARSCAPTPSR
jgi:hypothetical protein